MDKKILITYASKYGATAEIAQKIADGLKTNGLAVDILPAEKVKDISEYQAVILGAALYMGQWRKDAVQLLKTQQQALSKVPVYIFTSGPTGEGDPVELLQGRIVPDKLKPVLEVIHPREITVFGGNVDPAKMNGFEKWVMNKVKAASGDFRNWQAINIWAAKVISALNLNA